MNILIVDDSRTMRMIVKRTLRQAGYDGPDIKVSEAENGAEGLKAVQAGEFDVILSDWNMPEMNGVEMLEHLNKLGEHPPLVFVTSEGSEDMRRRAATLGAKGLIAKPFTPETFKETIQLALAKTKA